MSPDEVETFLAVCEHGTVSQAAQSLFVSQGTASARLKGLENELGVQLFHRQKGLRSVRLTVEGQTFLPLAEQMSALWNDARNLRDLAIVRELRITAPDVLNTLILGPVYQRFIREHPEIYLTVQTEHSSEAHQLVENQLSDLGFAFTLHPRFPNVIPTPLYSEKMVYLFHEGSAFDRSRSESDLRAEDEVYARWSHEFNLWHSQRFPHSSRRHITLGTASMFPLFIGNPKVWAIVSTTLSAKLTKEFSGLRSAVIPDPPPDRRCYLLTNRNPRGWTASVRDAFTSHLLEEVEQRDHLTPLQ